MSLKHIIELIVIDTNIASQLQFADDKLHAAEAALVAQRELITKLKAINADVDSSQKILDGLTKEISEWSSYKNMVRIKYQMMRQYEDSKT